MSVIESARRFVCPDIVFAGYVRAGNPNTPVYTPFPDFNADLIANQRFCAPHFINVSNGSGVVTEHFYVLSSYLLCKGFQGKENGFEFSSINV